MFEVVADWNAKQAHLKEIILNTNKFEEARQLLLEMHSLVHSSSVYKIMNTTYMDEICNGLTEAAFRTMPTAKDVTIAWDLWHLTRIEDLTANILIADGKPVLDESWLERLNTKVRDTGNAMTDGEIIAFSNEVGMEALFDYRRAVGMRTKTIIENLKPDDMKRKMDKAQLDRILDEGGLTEHKDSIWLMDFWGRKTVAGLFQMPITRHQIVHLNDCQKLKLKCRKIK